MCVINDNKDNEDNSDNCGMCMDDGVDIVRIENRLNQINPYSILSPFRKSKTSDFFEANIRTFDAKHPYFCPKKSDVFKGCDYD